MLENISTSPRFSRTDSTSATYFLRSFTSLALYSVRRGQIRNTRRSPKQLVGNEQCTNRPSFGGQRDVIGSIPRAHFIVPQHLEEPVIESVYVPCPPHSLNLSNTIPSRANLVSLSCTLICSESCGRILSVPNRDAYLGTFEHVYQAVYVRAVDVYSHKLASSL